MKRAFTRWKKNEAVIAIRRSRIILKNKFVDVRVQPKKHVIARILVVTPRKSGSAVERNRFRRRMKSLFYEYKMNQGDFDWIVFAKSGMQELTFGTLQELLVRLAQSLSQPQ